MTLVKMDNQLINDDNYYSSQDNNTDSDLNNICFEDDYYVIQNNDFIKENASNILIHLPKTAGTTLVTHLYNYEWTPSTGFYYRHINNKDYCSNASDIFLDWKNYTNYKIIMMIRDPFDRIISEYNFLKTRRQFMDLFDIPPTSFEDYINNSQTHNSMIKFLLGESFYSHKKISLHEYNIIKNGILNLDFIIGRSEKFSDSLDIINTLTSFNVQKSVQNKRISLNRDEIDNYDQLKEKFKQNNVYDYKLYNRLFKIFKDQLKMVKNPQKYNYIGDKYDYFYRFTEVNSPLQVFLLDIDDFINKHEKSVTLIDKLARTNTNKNGKKFCKNWCHMFINKFKLSDITIDEIEPLRTLKEISNNLPK